MRKEQNEESTARLMNEAESQEGVRQPPLRQVDEQIHAEEQAQGVGRPLSVMCVYSGKK
jgi:hypothetical protein